MRIEYDFNFNIQMPEYYCDDKDSRDWIKLMLSKLPQNRRVQAANQYSLIYLDAQEKEPLKHKKINKGIYAANIWLLRQVRRYEAIVKAQTKLPPKVM